MQTPLVGLKPLAMDDTNQEGEVSPHKGELMVEDNDVDSEKSASLNDN